MIRKKQKLSVRGWLCFSMLEGVCLFPRRQFCIHVQAGWSEGYFTWKQSTHASHRLRSASILLAFASCYGYLGLFCGTRDHPNSSPRLPRTQVIWNPLLPHLTTATSLWLTLLPRGSSCSCPSPHPAPTDCLPAGPTAWDKPLGHPEMAVPLVKPCSKNCLPKKSPNSKLQHFMFPFSLLIFSQWRSWPNVLHTHLLIDTIPHYSLNCIRENISVLLYL